MGFLIIPIIFGFCCAVVARKKGRSGLLWFAIGFFLPLIGLILILVIPTDETRIVQIGKMRKCPYCAELVKSEAIKCRFCGSELHNYKFPKTMGISFSENSKGEKNWENVPQYIIEEEVKRIQEQRKKGEL